MDHFDLAAARHAMNGAALAHQRTLDALQLINQPHGGGRGDIAWGKLMRSFSISKALSDRARERLDGVEREVNDEIAKRQPAQTPNSVLVPWAALATRADTVASAAGGGYLVQTANLTAADVLRPNLVCGPLGETIIPAPHGANVNLPKQTAAGTAYWLSGETTTAAEANQAFGQTAFMPKTVAAYTELSRLLKLQAAPSAADAIIANDLTKVLARAVDLAQLHGTGIGGTLTGLTTIAGTGAFSAATTNTATIVNAAGSLGDAFGPSTGLAAPLSVATALRQRQETATSRTLWEGNLLDGNSAGLRARSSTAVNAATLIIGSFEYLHLVVWGDLEISVNPYAGFQSGISGIRAMMTCDSGVTWPAAFTIGTSFT